MIADSSPEAGMQSTTRLRIAALIVAGATVTSFSQDPAPLVDGDQRILWIGNSYSDWCGPIGVCLGQMFAAATPPVENVQIAHRIKGMGILKEYYQGIEMTPSAVVTIRQGNWDYVVLQGWEDAYKRKDSELITADYVGWPAAQDTFVRYANLFDDEAAAVGAQLILFFPHMGTTMYDNSNYQKAWSTYSRVAEETGAFIMPGVEAFDSIHTVYPDDLVPLVYGGPDPSNNNGHQNSNGMALNTYFCYTILTGGRSPVGINPPGFQPANDCNGTFTPDFQQELQEIAYARAMQWLEGSAAVPCGKRNRAGRAAPVSSELPVWYTISGRQVCGHGNGATAVLRVVSEADTPRYRFSIAPGVMSTY
jgi:hypothetical protein